MDHLGELKKELKKLAARYLNDRIPGVAADDEDEDEAGEALIGVRVTPKPRSGSSSIRLSEPD